jgi:hypothetical protein
MDHLDGILYIDKARNIRDAMTPEEVAEAEAAAAEAAGIERIAETSAL